MSLESYASAILAACAVFLLQCTNCFLVSKKMETYRAAVYEHAVVMPTSPVTSRKEAMEHVMQNLKVYKTQAEIAGARGVDILVFPENGIYAIGRTRDDVKFYLETLPDPKLVSWNPCEDTSRFDRSDVQVFLSCLAKNNSLYLVANFGDVQICDFGDPNCPSDGQYQYNTDVVYDKSGRFIAKYHKQNLFFETQFNEPIHPEFVYFDTEFGRFGVFTCFDILFHDPAIPLVEKYNITDVAFPTAWMDALPYFSAIGYHSSFAVAHNVNFLAANLHIPTRRFQGSGIYTPSGANAFYYDRQSPDGKLLISDVAIASQKSKVQQRLTIPPQAIRNRSIGANTVRSVSFHDWYNFVSLVNNTGNVTICQDEFCCYLEYDKSATNERFAFGVFNGFHVYQGGYYLQICLLVKCTSDDPLSCGQLNYNSTTTFNSFLVSGNFSTPYVHPQMLQSEGGVLKLPEKGSWQYGSEGLRGSSMFKPLLSVALVGRAFKT